MLESQEHVSGLCHRTYQEPVLCSTRYFAFLKSVSAVLYNVSTYYLTTRFGRFQIMVQIVHINTCSETTFVITEVSVS